MSGVLFVVYIPSRTEEKVLRERREHDEMRLEMEKRSLSTPEMQRYGTFMQDTKGATSDDYETTSLSGHPKVFLTTPSEPLLRSKSSESLNVQSSGFIKRSLDGIKDFMSPRPKAVDDDMEYLNDLELAPDAYMEDIMTAIMKKKKLRRVTWLPTRNNEGHQILFNIENGSRCDDTIRLLSEWGVGEREGTSVSVLPCTLYYEPIQETKTEIEKHQDLKDSGWGRFINSVRARLNVAEIVHEVKASSTITFDFMILVIVAAILAAFGLVEDSTLFLAASMLISPLMGPIIGAIFGTVVKDRKLSRLGFMNEMIGLLVATCVGFVFGLFVCSIDEKYSLGEGITNEMMSRCEMHSLVIGIFIALASGAAVAIAILGDNTGSLVGTAISASLLPPAVNAGLMWALSLIYLFFQKDSVRYNSVIKTTYYSDHQSVELAIFGCISMCITITNIISIYLMGILFLKIKEVAPIRSHRNFWHHDVKIARDYNKTVHGNETENLVEDLANLKIQEKLEAMHGVSAELFKSQHTWSPMNHHFDKPHIRDLESRYLTLTHGSRLFTRHQSLKSPPPYKSIPDDTLLSPPARRSSAIDIPKPSTQSVSSSCPSNSGGSKDNKKRFVVTRTEDDLFKRFKEN